MTGVGLHPSAIRFDTSETGASCGRGADGARDSAGVPIEVARYVGRMPITVRTQIGDRITCTQSTDPAMVGREFWVSFDETQEFAVDRQVRLERLGDRGQG